MLVQLHKYYQSSSTHIRTWMLWRSLLLSESNSDVTPTTANRVRWNSEGGFWELSWLLLAEGEPTWIKRAWLALVTEEEAVPRCVPPLIAQVQEHKVSTPVP